MEHEPDAVSKQMVLGTVMFALIILGMVVSFFILSSVDVDGAKPTFGQRMAAFYANIYMTMTFVYLLALMLNGAVRNSPFASWIMPGSVKIKMLSDQVHAQASKGQKLSDGQYQFMAGVANRNGLWVCGTLIFCGIVILKM